MEPFGMLVLCMAGIFLLAAMLNPTSSSLQKRKMLLSENEIPIYENIRKSAEKYGFNVTMKHKLTELAELKVPSVVSQKSEEFLFASDLMIDFVIINRQAHALLLIVLEENLDVNAQQKFQSLAERIRSKTGMRLIAMRDTPEDLKKVEDAIKKCC